MAIACVSMGWDERAEPNPAFVPLNRSSCMRCLRIQSSRTFLWYSTVRFW